MKKKQKGDGTVSNKTSWQTVSLKEERELTLWIEPLIRHLFPEPTTA
jgi:hypothetical protein